MDIEKIKAILLAAACFFMACLNLWNLFKDWFDKKYQSRKGNEGKNQQPQTKEQVPDIIGKSKFKLSDEKMPKPEDPLKKEIAELKEMIQKQSEQLEKYKPFMSIPIEREKHVEEEPVNPEEEYIPILTEKERSPFSTGTTIDEFELVVKTLQGKPITKEEETQVTSIIPKIEGTDIFNQFTRQIHGAEERAMAILNKIEDNKQALSSNATDCFDYREFIRE